ncbi:TetR family transcriptional regulator [Nocardia nova]|uniref:TetR/AcrR family transcriptional regulator n=1 Tax=Nocardia nova TaxID=37330 RepID=UPI000CEA442D|nr:TetR family transcriptional regulator [Nocardia nova]
MASRPDTTDSATTDSTPAEPGETTQIRSVWTREHRQRREQPALSREQIVAEAIALLDAEGFESLSMRKLGSRLGAGATSLYTHVANKDELLELVVDEAFSELRLPAEPIADWRAAMLELCHDIRHILLRHPWTSMVMTTAGLVYLGPNMLRLSESMLTILEGAGFDTATADRASNTLLAYVIGATSTEAAMLTSIARSGLDEQVWFDQFMTAAELAARPYPRISQRFAEHRGHDSTRIREDNFDEELGLILDGLHARRRS